MEHILKIKVNYAIDILKNGKNFEVRKNDRNYQKGDTVSFNVIDGFGKTVTQNLEMPKYEITYVLHGGEYGLDEDYCVFGIKPIKEE